MASGPHRLGTHPAFPDRVRRRAWIAVGALGAVLAAWGLSFAETSVDEVRVANPSPPDPLPAIEWVGRSVTDFWVPIFYGVTFAVMALMGWIFFRYWRRTGRAHAGWPIFIALGAVGLIGDPIFNWAMYCNYHPELLHWPVNLPLMNVAPTVEPLWIVMGAYQVFFLGPAMLALGLYGRAFAKAGPGSWVRRHPGWSLLAFATVFGAGMDVLMEQWMLNMKIYKYTQIAGPTMTWGEGHLQVFEIIWIGLLIGFYAILLQRDDTGASRCARWARSFGPFRRLRLGQWGTAFVLVAVSLSLYGGFWTVLRETGSATSIADGEYPYRAVKTYDPDGRMQASGQPAPYFEGTWCLGAGCKPN